MTTLPPRLLEAELYPRGSLKNSLKLHQYDNKLKENIFNPANQALKIALAMRHEGK